MARAKKTVAEPVTAPITAYKGFREDLTCSPEGKPFQFEIGGTYRHEGKVKACKSGFHVITGHPLALFQYYAPAGTRICQVEISGKMDSDDGGEKTAAEILTIGKEIGLTQLILDAVKWVNDRAKPVDGNFTAADQTSVMTADYGGAATASGTRGAATASGYQGAATASGTGGAATASGDWGAATASGDGGAATASGYQGAATASGTRGAATASGDGGAATASGWRGAATSSGYAGKVRGKTGCALFLAERGPNGEILNVWAGIAGRDGIEPDTFYRLVDGKPVKAE
jgi:hypothetical protein